MYVYPKHGIGDPGVLGLIPVAAKAVSSVTSAARTESHIADRVKKYQGLPDSQLQDIIRMYGGEMAEAARRVLASRGSPTVPAAAAQGPVFDLSKIVKLPEVTTTSKVEVPPMLVYGGLALAGVVALSLLGRRRS